MIELAEDKISLFLTNMKLIYQHGVSHSKNKAKIHRLFAIHNYHYAVEQIVREHARDMSFKDATLHKINFEAILKRVHKKESIPYYDRLLELNRIRNNAEHYYIIPDVETVALYSGIVLDFLKWSYDNYFAVDYESLALEDMIRDAPTRRVMREAKALIEKGDLKAASNKMVEGLGAFKFMSFAYLADSRAKGMLIGETDLSEILADLAFKIILVQDEWALRKFMPIRTFFESKNGKITGVRSKYSLPLFKDKERARVYYEDILHIILTYQDRMAPPFVWRKKTRKSEILQET